MQRTKLLSLNFDNFKLCEVILQNRDLEHKNIFLNKINNIKSCNL